MNTKELLLLSLVAPLLAVFVLYCPGLGRAEGPADWKRAEQRCIAACPKPSLRYQPGESAKQQQLRIQQEDRYNACFLRCTRTYVNHYPNLGKGQGGASMIYRRK
ncbi:MAG: hypothetical protein V3573_12185 [Desulfovibrionaceae bacterium]